MVEGAVDLYARCFESQLLKYIENSRESMSIELQAKLKFSKSNYARCIGQHESIRKCAAVCGRKRARRASGKQ